MGLLRRRPLVSVVVPAYQVEDLLGECLASILGQSWHELEVIVVDDGSTDRTGEIADRYASDDRRVRVVHQDNAGLGAARNIGVEHATGDYLTFVDSDDVVLDGAYATLTDSLRRSGSDFSVGAVERVEGARRFMTPLMRENHQRSRPSIRIEESPLMLADVFAWNKVYRRAFWEDAGLRFPEAVRYEDQPTLTRALVAGRFDVLADKVYLWRVRADGSSISQQRGDVRDLRDRMTTKRWSTATVREGTSSAVQQVWYRRVLPIDMPEYFRAVPGVSPEYWAALRQGLAEFWGRHTVPIEETGLLPRHRIMGWLVAEDRRADLEEFLAFLDSHPGPLPEVYPFSDDPTLPPSLRDR
jgi:glycosyltransferase involved in cell wall biosynthesis